MIITRSFNGIPTPAYVGLTPQQRTRLAHWQRDNAVLYASTRRQEFLPIESPLSIKTMLRGASTFVIGGRRLVADDDQYLVVNSGEVYSSSMDAARPQTAFCVYFRPGMQDEVAAGLRQDLDTALLRGPRADREPIEFSGHLRFHDDAVSPALDRIRAGVVAGRNEDDWYEEAFQELLARLIEADSRHRSLVDRIGAAKRGTREELQKRIGWATDFINSGYMDPITLDDIASAASLSKFHLARLFKHTVGITPHNYLQRKRTRVAQRLIATTDMDLGEVAMAAGFGSRWTMYRFLRKSFGAGGRRLRGGQIAA